MNLDEAYRGNWEIIPTERGKKWEVINSFIVSTRYGDVEVEEGFIHDRFTFVPDLPNSIIASIVHDWLADKKTKHQFVDGTDCTRKQADTIFRDLIWNSKDKKWAYPYYWGVRFWAIVTRKK